MDTASRLRTVQLFASLSADNLALLAEVAAGRSYSPGSLLHRQDESDQTFYIIERGEVILHQTDLRGMTKPVGYLQPGDATGEEALLLDDAHSTTAQAIKNVDALCITKDNLDRLVARSPSLWKQLTPSRIVQERLRVKTFAWQPPDEPSLLLRRKHWFVFARSLFFPFLVLALLGAAVWLLGTLGVQLSWPTVLLSMGGLPALIVVWVYIDWQNDFYLVTAKRVLHREKVVLLHETWDEAPIDKIQNINILRRPMGNLLGFGTMIIQTASRRGNVTFEYLPDPEGMQDLIFKQVRLLQSRIKRQEEEQIRQEFKRQTEPSAEMAPPFPVPDTPLPPPKSTSLLSQLLATPLLGLRYVRGDQIIWRKHWLFLLQRIGAALSSVVLLSALIVVAIYRWPAQYSASMLLVSLVLWIVSVAWLWWTLEDWRNDIYIVSDSAIADIVKKPLFFAEERKQAPLEAIQNVSLRQKGIVATLLDYGDVLIQTAGASGEFTFARVGHPGEVQREIFRRIEAHQERQRRREREQKAGEFATWFRLHNEYQHQKQGS